MFTLSGILGLAILRISSEFVKDKKNKSRKEWKKQTPKSKKQRLKYGHLPAKEAEVFPWERLCVDLIGPYTIERKNQKNLTLKAVTMIDPATGWLEIEQYHEDREAITIANIVENTWLTRYPRPDICTIDSALVPTTIKLLLAPDMQLNM